MSELAYLAIAVAINPRLAESLRRDVAGTAQNLGLQLGSAELEKLQRLLRTGGEGLGPPPISEEQNTTEQVRERQLRNIRVIYNGWPTEILGDVLDSHDLRTMKELESKLVQFLTERGNTQTALKRLREEISKLES